MFNLMSDDVRVRIVKAEDYFMQERIVDEMLQALNSHVVYHYCCSKPSEAHGRRSSTSFLFLDRCQNNNYGP